MVAISVTPAKGNAGARWYPHSGHLGLTPVKVEGIVRTRLEEDGKPVMASAVTVALRCYEARMGRVGGVLKSTVLAEQSQTLWTPPSGEFGPLGTEDLPFRIVLPTNTAGSSTFHLQDYRVYWRIEASINTPHIPGIGNRQVKCFDVNLIRFNKPSTSHRPEQPTPTLHLQSPRQPVAPLDPIPLSLRIQPRPGTSLHRAIFALERRIEFFDASPASSTTQLPTSTGLSREISRESSPVACSSTSALLASPPRRRSPSPVNQALAAKTIEAVLATTEITDMSKPESDTMSAMLQVPVPKSNAHWGVGETMQGGLARVRFFVTAKVHMLSGPAEVIESCEEEITIIPVDDAERLRVHSKYSMKRPATSPSSIENHQESRRPVPHLPSPPPSPNNLTVPVVRHSKSGKRPHTASGARDSSQRRALPLRPRSRGNEQTPVPAVFEPEQFRAWERELDRIAPPARPRSSSALRLFGSKKQRSPEPRPAEDFRIGVARTVVVPSIRTADVLEWEAEVERFSSASAREAVLKGRGHRTPLPI